MSSVLCPNAACEGSKKYGALKVLPEGFVIFNLAAGLAYVEAVMKALAEVVMGGLHPLGGKDTALEGLKKGLPVHDPAHTVHVWGSVRVLLHVIYGGPKYWRVWVPSYLKQGDYEA